jgi:CRP/FNR family transcriptional regulator, cyclic AMP receptor protein
VIEVKGVALLDEDPELATAIPADEREQATRAVVVAGFTVPVGPLELPGEHLDPSLGLLVLEGLITVNVVLGDRVASQLSGPGDVIDLAATPDALLPASLSYAVSETSRVAVLDRRFITAVRRWPGLLLALHERLRDQERRLAIHAAIGKLRRIEDRVLALLWHLGERWGRMAPEGVIVPLSLTHETIGRLAGAERPTVSLALAELTRTGDIARRPDGAFVLAHGSAMRLRPERVPDQQLRPLAVQLAAGDDDGPATLSPETRSSTLDRDALHRRLAALHDEMPERIEEVSRIIAASREAAERSLAVRERIAARRNGGS